MTTTETKAPAAPAPAAPAPSASTPKKASSQTLLLGFDLGTNTSCLMAGPPSGSDIAVSKIVPTVVGYVKEGIVSGIIPGNANRLFGEEALRNRLHLRVVAPLEHGIIAHPEAARDFMVHARKLVDPSESAAIRVVFGVPANANEESREEVRRAARGTFDRVLLIPEPFLAALGYRDDSRLGQANYVDPVMNSLFIDIGGGTSDLCLVQGYFPTGDDQISLPFAGDAIDRLILDEIEGIYPDAGLSINQAREIKETHAYVGKSRKPIDVKLIIGGKGRMLELGDTIGNACNELFERVYEATKDLITRASSDSAADLLQNIIITGGGSMIRGIDTELQRRLTEDGFESPKVKTAGPEYKRFVGIGALKAARAARENQWQHLLT